MELKSFQCAALDRLKAYLELARSSSNPERAFIQTLRQMEPDRVPPSYRTIPGLPGVPNVCLRLPTGAGKTLLAAHTIAVAGRSYLERDFPAVLWLVPTNTIRRQTAEALRKPSHSYRAAIDQAFQGRVAVFDISEIWQIRPQDLTESVSIIVSTIQTLRINNREGRKVYDHSENFEPHFVHISEAMTGLERLKDGRIKFSFVNLMAVHHPLVIVDEAHKAGTSLSFDMLAALRPSLIVEFTATPNTHQTHGSNVLFRASAAEVKAAEMIKLPIILTEHPDWRAAIHDAIETRARLADTAKRDPRYIRPIALFQAQDKGQEVTVEVLKKFLMENENISPERIAVATGEQRELDAINLFDHTCPVEFIITVEALKEGWDCSFAYVLCSVANISSATDIEQLLGRVLRMPYAKSRPNEALNRAYTHVSCPRFGEGARQLTDTLVQKMGFEPDEASAVVEQRQALLPGLAAPGDLFYLPPVLLETLESPPDLSGLDAEVAARVDVQPLPNGTVTVAIHGDIPDELERRLIATTTKPEAREVLRVSVQRHRIIHRNSTSSAARGEKLTVPRLCLYVQGKLEPVEEELILELEGWRLNDYPAELSSVEFSIRETAECWEVDYKGEQVVYSHLDQQVQLDIGLLKLDWTDLQLSRWIDRQCFERDREAHRTDITQPVRLEFCRKMVAYLQDQRRISLNNLVRFKYQLAKAVHEKIFAYRRQACKNGYQAFLFSPEAQVETSFADCFIFDKNCPYPATRFYSGACQFHRHFYGPYMVGAFDSKDEYDCAFLINHMPQVKHWIRNLSGHPETSFWLPTSIGRFYPDFVVELQDGRYWIIEYKGEHLIDKQETKEKKNIGELWAEKSGGKGIFLMAEKRNSKGQSLKDQLDDAVS
jgi:type III restriction enzyme